METGGCTIDRDEQLRRWVAGESLHDEDGRCCPDYSCCYLHLLVPREERQFYLTAYREEKQKELNRMEYRYLARKLACMVTEDTHERRFTPL